MRQLVRLACTVAALLASGCVNLDGVTEDPQSPFQGKGTPDSPLSLQPAGSGRNGYLSGSDYDFLKTLQMSGITGMGTSGTLPLFTGARTLGNSIISQDMNNGNIAIHLTRAGNANLSIDNGSSDPKAEAFITVNTDTGAALNMGRFAGNNTSTSFGIPQLGDWSMIVDVAPATTGKGLIIGTAGGPGGTPLVFGTNNLERMRITGSGNVGIGTATPGSRLTVAGDVEVKGQGFGFVLHATDGPKCFRISVNNAGQLSTSETNGCPP